MWDAPGADNFRDGEDLMKKQFACILGGAWLLGMGAIASMGACSGDDTTNKDSGTKDQSVTDTGNKDVAQQDQNSGDTGSDAGTADCGSIPSLHTSEAGAIFCGYQPDGGPAFSCSTGMQCCLGGKVGQNFLPEDCVTFGGACDNPPPDASSPGLPIECNQNADCTANGKTGNVCCLQGASAPALVQGCGYYKSSLGAAITCETASAGACTGASDIQICEQQSDCPSAKTCTPMKWKLYQLGFCL
jgi:hypothetical protein